MLTTNYNFELKGEVIHGKKRGKSLGFPTANFIIDPHIPPGIYLSITEVLGNEYPSITFIGMVDTFDETDFVGESYILDFNQDIYGEEITVKVLKKLRDNQKFESEKKLVEQMKKDEEKAKKYFISHKSFLLPTYYFYLSLLMYNNPKLCSRFLTR